MVSRNTWLAGGIAAFLALAGTVGASALAFQDTKAPAAVEGEDLLIFRNGNVLKGTIISETDKTIRFKGAVSGMAFEMDYQLSDILEVKRAKKAETKDAKAEKPKPGTTSPVVPPPLTKDAKTPEAPKSTTPTIASTPAAPASTDSSATKVYMVPLKGQFGEDVSETPILQAVRDAKSMGAKVIVLEIDSVPPPPEDPRMDPEQFAWNYVRRAEHIFPIITEVIPKEWGADQPRVVMIVNNALGGAAFLPFGFKEIYFRPEGKWGGIGGLSRLFGGRGDEEVREKQRSLRLGHVEGWANYGGYDYRIVRAMARTEYVCSLRVVNGKGELVERLPSDPSEELLTDDGKEGNADSLKQVVAGTGNDELTLDARVAQLLGVSRGTVENDEQLLSVLDLGRGSVLIKDRGERIMKNWHRSLEGAKDSFVKAVQEYRDLRMDDPNNYENRTKFRGQQKSKLMQMKNILERFDEGLSEWAQNEGMPGAPMIETRIKEIELEQSLDRREPRR